MEQPASPSRVSRKGLAYLLGTAIMLGGFFGYGLVMLYQDTSSPQVRLGFQTFSLLFAIWIGIGTVQIMWARHGRKREHKPEESLDTVSVQPGD